MFEHSYDLSDPARPHKFTHATTGQVIRCAAGEEAFVSLELNQGISSDIPPPLDSWQIPYARDFKEPPYSTDQLSASSEALADLWPVGSYNQK